MACSINSAQSAFANASTDKSESLPFESAFAKAMADKIGFDWVCFSEFEGEVYFHNPLSNRSLISFRLFGNWVCFA
jgi:hypothetical protein